MGTGSRVVRPSTTPVVSQLKMVDSRKRTVAAVAAPSETQPALRTVWQRQVHVSLPPVVEAGTGNRPAVEFDAVPAVASSASSWLRLGCGDTAGGSGSSSVPTTRRIRVRVSRPCCWMLAKASEATDVAAGSVTARPAARRGAGRRGGQRPDRRVGHETVHCPLHQGGPPPGQHPRRAQYADRPRTRCPALADRGTVQQRDRRAAGSRGEHGQNPCQPHPHEARPPRPGAAAPSTPSAS